MTKTGCGRWHTAANVGHRYNLLLAATGHQTQAGHINLVGGECSRAMRGTRSYGSQGSLELGELGGTAAGQDAIDCDDGAGLGTRTRGRWIIRQSRSAIPAPAR